MKLRWGIIGTGHIAGELADGVRESTTGELVAVSSRNLASAQEFGNRFGIPHQHGSYEDLLADDSVEAVYIATPHPVHAEWAIKAAEAGKHILCEKPIGLNWAEAVAIIDAAKANDVFLMEAFMYRCHPQTKKLVELIREGAIGKVQMINAAFSYHGGNDLSNRAYAQELGGGGILDVGCYPVSMSRLLAGSANGLPFVEPQKFKAVGQLGPTGVDIYSTAVAEFPGEIVAHLTTGVGLHIHQSNTVEVFGTDGYLMVADPWIPSRYSREPLKIVFHRYKENETQSILVDAPQDLYTYEADAVARSIEQRQAPEMSWDDTLGNMRVLDSWRREIGLVYESEKPQNYMHTVSRRPLSAKTPTTMRYGKIAGLEKPVSRLIMGTHMFSTMPEAALMYDTFWEHGGNTFDTSHGYGHNGSCEKLLGQWIKNRGLEKEAIVIAKGANHPNDNGEGLTRELKRSLENMQMDQVDMYMIHRDNPQVPIEEWMDALNENFQAGRMKILGISNFTQERVQAAIEYAQRKGLQSISMLSNQLSLALMLAPVWDGCVSSTAPEFRQWLTQTQLPLLPWSSQARGFFTERASRDNLSDEEFNRCWYSEENFARKERCEQLAAQLGVEPVNVALAYVLCQPFPTFPLIGPLRPREVASSVAALDIELAPEQLSWLDGTS